MPHSSAPQPVRCIHQIRTLAGPVKQPYLCLTVVNENPRLGWTAPQALAHPIVFTVRRLDCSASLILNQLASVLPARLKLFRTNGPVVLAGAVQDECTVKNKHLNKTYTCKWNFH